MLHHITAATIAGLMAMGASSSAAVAPLSPEDLRKGSTHIIKGRVLEVKSRTEKSQFEGAFGLHRDRVFAIRLQVMKVSKGKGVTPGEKVCLLYTSPSPRDATLSRMPSSA